VKRFGPLEEVGRRFDAQIACSQPLGDRLQVDHQLLEGPALPCSVLVWAVLV